MADAPLYVRHRGELVGTIDRANEDRITFTYADAWLERDDAFPISLSLPLRRPPARERAARRFFANLLPEGLVRQRICNRLKIPVDDDMALLERIGGDCAGALSVTAGDEPAAEDRYEAIAADELAAWSEGSAPVFSAVSGAGGVRLSLAGAQDKLPVMFDDDGFWLPMGSSPSTHILKLETPDFRHLPANEVFTTLIGKQLGLPCVDVELHRTSAKPIAVVRRYDRQIREDRVLRLHQEDMCQALALGPLRKYEHSGGPSFADCVAVARAHCSQPLTAIDALLRWLVFNVVIGNADAHAKNVSFLFSPPGGVSLAPFYDLVCTRAYERLDPSLAMSIGGSFDADTVTRARWEQTASEVGVQPRVLLETVRELAGRAPEATGAAEDGFRQRFGASPAVAGVATIVRKRARRVLSLLAE